MIIHVINSEKKIRISFYMNSKTEDKEKEKMACGKLKKNHWKFQIKEKN